MAQHIVAVDDDESVRSLIEDYLTEQGFAAQHVANPLGVGVEPEDLARL